MDQHSALRRKPLWAVIVHEGMWITNLVLIGFMVSMFFLRMVVGDGGMETILKYLPFALFPYVMLQNVETAVRESTRLARFVVDSSLAFITVALGVALIVAFYRTFPTEEKLILAACVLAAFTDLSMGLLASMRIGAGWKERDENQRP